MWRAVLGGWRHPRCWPPPLLHLDACSYIMITLLFTLAYFLQFLQVFGWYSRFCVFYAFFQQWDFFILRFFKLFLLSRTYWQTSLALYWVMIVSVHWFQLIVNDFVCSDTIFLKKLFCWFPSFIVTFVTCPLIIFLIKVNISSRFMVYDKSRVWLKINTAS